MAASPAAGAGGESGIFDGEDDNKADNNDMNDLLGKKQDSVPSSPVIAPSSGARAARAAASLAAVVEDDDNTTTAPVVVVVAVEPQRPASPAVAPKIAVERTPSPALVEGSGSSRSSPVVERAAASPAAGRQRSISPVSSSSSSRESAAHDVSTERASRSRRGESTPGDLGDSSSGRVSRADRLKLTSRRGERNVSGLDLSAAATTADPSSPSEPILKSPRSQQLRAQRSTSSRGIGGGGSRRGGGGGGGGIGGDEGDQARVRELEAKVAEMQGKLDGIQFQKDQLSDEIDLLKDDLQSAEEKMREAINAKDDLLARIETLEEDLADEKERGEYDRGEAEEAIEALKDELQSKATATAMAQQQVEQLTKLVETQKFEIAMLGSTGASSSNDLIAKIAALETQLKEQQTKFEREKSLMEEQGHGSSGSRPNRLQQLTELSDARQRDKEKYEALLEEQKQQIESMKGEMNELAMVNAEMVKAIEEMSAGGDSASSSFELKGLHEQIRQLEAATHRQLEVIQTNESTIDEMGRELVAKTDECEELQQELVNARSDQKTAEGKIVTLEAQLKKLEAESQHLKKNRGKEQGEQEEQLDALAARLDTVTEERDALLVAKGELESAKAVLERELKELKREAKDNEEEWGEQSKDLKERLNDAIQARWSLEEALRSAGVDPDEVDAALLNEKMQSSSKEQAGAIKTLQENLVKAEKTIKEMRDVYSKTKADAESAIASRDAALAEQTAKIAKLTLALKQANDAKEELEAELQQYEVVDEEEGGEEEEEEEEE